MHSIRKWALGGIASLLIGGLALAQTVNTFNLTGNEIVRSSIGNGGTALTSPSYVFRGGENHTLVAAGTTVTTPVPNTSSIVLATGAITTWNIVLPTSPYTGQRVIIGCPGGTVTTLAITATAPSGVAIVGTNPTSCSTGGTIAQGVAFTYSTSAKTWYRYL